MTLDPRLNAFREDLADVRLRDRVAMPRYAEGRKARIAIGIAPLRRQPLPEAPVDTFLHYGEEVLVFDENGGHAWCQALRDDYVGYVLCEALASGEGSAPTHYLATLGAYRYAGPDLRSPPIDFLPRHSAVVAAETGLVTRGTEYARLDGGGFVPASCLATEPPRSADLAAAAALYLGCPYLWGGRSWLGVDCSGLVQEAFRDLSVSVPRDTDMQRETIGDVVTVVSPEDLRRNDLLYMPGHVLIYAGNGEAIHAYGGSMMVLRGNLAGLMRGWGCGTGDFTVRRLK
jgi:cell wall-associated NlpC family hydrolase